MASFDAVRALGEALLELMRERCPLAELDLAAGAAFTLPSYASLGGAAGSTAPAEGFHLCLWRTTVSGMPRNLPPRRAADGTLMRSSLPLDLHYLLLPVAADGRKQARMLGWALRFMHELPVLSGPVINRYAPGGGAFADHETVELIADPLPLADHLALWDRLKAGFQPGMTYVARMVLIDSDQPEPGSRRVAERQFDLGRLGAMP